MSSSVWRSNSESATHCYKERTMELTSQENHNIRVLVRMRPVTADTTCSIFSRSSTSLSFSHADEGGDFGFEFDRVLDESASQEAVFAEIKHVVLTVLSGRNGTILSYGQTGSGKTYTLIGDILSSGSQGVIPRAAAEIFAAVESADPRERFVVRVSAVEIYCERIRDLLSFTAVSNNLTVQQALMLDCKKLQDASGATSVAGAQQEAVRSQDELLAIMQVGLANRAVAATGMNATSSRSHCLVFLEVHRLWADGSGRETFGKLSLVDLAGSERQDRTNAAGQTLEEGKLINKSLSALGNVVSGLADPKRSAGHVPYRDSKLTRVLQDSLGGNAQTALIVCCSPAREDAAESLSALRFGARAAGIVNTVQTNSRTQRAPGAAAKQLEAAQQECEKLKRQLADVQSELEGIKYARLRDGQGKDVTSSGGAAHAADLEKILLVILRAVILLALAVLPFM